MIFDKKLHFQSRASEPQKIRVTTSTPKKSSHDLDAQKSKSAPDAHFSDQGSIFQSRRQEPPRSSRSVPSNPGGFPHPTKASRRPNSQKKKIPTFFLLTRLFFANSLNFTLETFPKWKSRSLIPKIALPSRNSDLFVHSSPLLLDRGAI